MSDRRVTKLPEEIEITPAMTEAGAERLAEFFSFELDAPEKIARSVFCAMFLVYEEAKEARVG